MFSSRSSSLPRRPANQPSPPPQCSIFSTLVTREFHYHKNTTWTHHDILCSLWTTRCSCKIFIYFILHISETYASEFTRSTSMHSDKKSVKNTAAILRGLKIPSVNSTKKLRCLLDVLYPKKKSLIIIKHTRKIIIQRNICGLENIILCFILKTLYIIFYSYKINALMFST